MKSLMMLAVVSLSIGIAAWTRTSSQNRNRSEEIREQFVGAWKLLWLEDPDADGKIHKADCTGLLVYTRDGHMSVQVMFKNPPTASNAAPIQYAQGGYEASYGTFHIDDNAKTFLFHVEGGLVRTLVGKDLPRAFEITGKQMIVKSTNPDEHWRVAWEHY